MYANYAKYASFLIEFVAEFSINFRMRESKLSRTLLPFTDLIFANPFLPERKLLEDRILMGEERIGCSPPARLEALVGRAMMLEREVLPAKTFRKLSAKERYAAASLALFILFHQLIEDLDPLVESGGKRSALNCRAFRKLVELIAPRKALLAGSGDSTWGDPAHLLACFFQLRRAFHYINAYVVGTSGPVESLRGRIWESVFTRDMRRFQLWMHRSVGRFPTLVLGPSGSGKELVARAIGQSRFLAYNASSHLFENGGDDVFYPVNLAALSPTVIESELFGHVRGAFTGAHADRRGLFETCGSHGAVFLDEIGEVGGDLQVKLLRLLQSGEFQRLGDTSRQFFTGKIIAATNRDLAREMEEGRFREDLFYRICGDQVQTPSLRTILDEDASELERFVAFICARLFGKEAAGSLAPEIAAILQKNPAPDYLWPGNFRELEQAVRNVVVTGSYSPALPQAESPVENAFQSAKVSLAKWSALYVERALQVHGSQRKAAVALDVDPRTFKRYLLMRDEGQS